MQENITDKKPPNWWPSSRVQSTWHRLCHNFRLQGEVDRSFSTRHPLPRCTCMASSTPFSSLLLLLSSFYSSFLFSSFLLLLLPLHSLPLFSSFSSILCPLFHSLFLHSLLPPAVCPRVWGAIGWWLQGRLPLFTHKGNGTGGEKEGPVKPVCPAQWDSPCSGACHTRVWGPCQMPR